MAAFLRLEDATVRIACFDLGSNATRFLMAEWRCGELNEIAIGGEITSLADALDESGYLHFNGLKRSLNALMQFVKRARKLNVQPVCILATAALRDARNGREVADAIHDHIGVPVVILPPDAEAKLSFRGALSKLPIPTDTLSQIALADVGGRSTEIVIGGINGSIERLESLPIGSQRLTHQFISHHPIPLEQQRLVRNAIRKALRHLRTPLQHCEHLIGAGGTATTLAMLDQRLSKFSMVAIHGYKLSRERVVKWSHQLARLSIPDCERLPGMERGRERVIWAGAAIVACIMSLGEFEQVIISGRCLMHGALEHLLHHNIKLDCAQAIQTALMNV